MATLFSAVQLLMAALTVIYAINIHKNLDIKNTEQINVVRIEVFAAFWIFGYSMMSLCSIDSISYIFRAIGLLGVYCVSVSIVFFVNHFTQAESKFCKGFLVCSLITAIVTYLLAVGTKNVRFVSTPYGTAMVSQWTWVRIIQTIYFLATAIYGLVRIVGWLKGKKRQRDRYAAIMMIVATAIIPVGAIFDAILPSFGYASLPLSEFTLFIGVSLFYFVIADLNVFSISVKNMSNFIYEDADTPILLIDEKGVVVLRNQCSYDFFGVDREDKTNLTLSSLFELSAEDEAELLRDMFNGNESSTMMLSVREKPTVTHVKINKINDSYGEPLCLIVFVSDMTKQYHVQEILEEAQIDLQKKLDEKTKQAENQRDYLTNLFNRRSGEHKIMEYLSEHDGCFMLVDLDNFKEVNDTYGHLSGDYALKLVAEVLKKHENKAIISRVGGDEFVYFIKDVETIEEAENVVKGIVYSFNAKREEEEILKDTSLSIGVALSSMDGRGYSELFSKADKALYFVKNNGKSGYAFYSVKERLWRQVPEKVDLNQLILAVKSKAEYKGAFKVEFKQFSKIYNFAEHYAKRNNQSMHLMMVGLEFDGLRVPLEDMEEAMECLSEAIEISLRGVDISTRFSSIQHLVILMDAQKEYLYVVTERIEKNFSSLYLKNNLRLNFDMADIEI